MPHIPDTQEERFSFQAFSANPPNLHRRCPATLNLSPVPHTAFTITCFQAPSLSFLWLLEAGGAHWQLLSKTFRALPHQDSAICLGCAPTCSIPPPPSFMHTHPFGMVTSPSLTSPLGLFMLLASVFAIPSLCSVFHPFYLATS